MVDGPAPTRDIIAPSGDFRNVAESAGVKLKVAMQTGLVPAKQNPAYLFFDIKSFDTETPDGRSNLLKTLMDDFEKEEFRRLHSVGTLEWRRVMVIEKGTLIEESRFRDREEDPWLLALFAKDKDKIGRTYSLHSRFKVEYGDIFVGYEVVHA